MKNRKPQIPDINLKGLNRGNSAASLPVSPWTDKFNPVWVSGRCFVHTCDHIVNMLWSWVFSREEPLNERSVAAQHLSRRSSCVGLQRWGDKKGRSNREQLRRKGDFNFLGMKLRASQLTPQLSFYSTPPCSTPIWLIIAFFMLFFFPPTSFINLELWHTREC